jgi:toxin ParE1/3/4
VRAEADIVNGYRYGVERFGIDQADRYDKGLRRAISLIAETPMMAPERPEFSPTVRIHHHAGHAIVYLIATDHILIVRVLRDEVDLHRHL